MTTAAKRAVRIGNPNYRTLHRDGSEESRKTEEFMDDLGIAYEICECTGNCPYETLPCISSKFASGVYCGFHTIITNWQSWTEGDDISDEDKQILAENARFLMATC